jgi:predicted DNA-binding transcriptional regulator AlpA
VNTEPLPAWSLTPPQAAQYTHERCWPVQASPADRAREPALLLTARQAAALCGVSAATWHRMVASGRCPAPVRLSAGCVRWRRGELEDWIAAGCPDRRTWEALQTARNGKK